MPPSTTPSPTSGCEISAAQTKRLWRWNLIAAFGIFLPALCAEGLLRYQEPMMRWGNASVLVQKINHYKNRASLKYITVSASFKTLPQQLYCKLTGQKYEASYSYPDILNGPERDRFLDELRIVMDEPQSDAMWVELIESYRQEMAKLKQSLNANHSDLVLMYVPAGEYLKPNHRIEKTREMFERLIKDEQIPVWDLLPDFSEHATTETTYEPVDGHYRPLGHELVANFVEKQLAGMDVKQQAVAHKTRSKILGDLDPFMHERSEHRPDIAVYELKVNGQGLRLDYELEFPKKKPRIAFYGDSMTIGYYVDNDQTWGALLNQKVPQYEFIITGKSGCTLPDFVYSFDHHGKFLEADLIVLTYNDSDLMDMLDPFRRVMSLDPKGRRGEKLTSVQQDIVDRTLARLKEHANDPDYVPAKSNSKIAAK
ncbi:alginate O-acetyltransferase AlgX-related protein [Lacunimicrobium album]